MKRLGALLIKYREQVAYLFFGGLTTLVSLLSYRLAYYVLYIPNTAATLISWVLAVTFAFLTNRRWVFKSGGREGFWREAGRFYLGRAATGVLELLWMWVTVDILHWHPMLMRTVVTLVVIVLNYVISKLLVFRKK